MTFLYYVEGDTPPPLPKRPYILPARLFIPGGTLSKVLRDVVTLRPVVSHFRDFTRGLQLNNKYLENATFCMWKGNITFYLFISL